MKKKWIPLQRLVTYIVMCIFLMVFAVLLYFNQREYSYLIDEQGEATLHLLSENTEENLESFLTNVQTATLFYGDYIEKMNYANDNDLTNIQGYSMEVAERLQRDINQISVIYYADLQGRFCATRIVDVYNLRMILKDDTTDNKLIFYQGKTTNSGILNTIEDYDPTKRSWFQSFLENPIRHWSDVYLVYDDNYALGIASMKPIFYEGKIAGLVGVEVRLQEISEFLIKNKSKGRGIIYILNKENQIVANSTWIKFIDFTQTNPSVMSMQNAEDCIDKRIKYSAEILEAQKVPFGKAFEINVEGTNYFGMVTALEKPEEMEFRIVTLIPESDIVGNMKSNQQASILIIFIIFSLGALIASLVLRRVLRPVIRVSEKALQISEDNFGELLKEPAIPIAETHALIEAFNKMTEKIQLSYQEIRASEKNFRSLVENSDDFILNLTPSGKIMSVNESYTQFVRMSRNDLIGENIFDIMNSRRKTVIWREQWNKILTTKSKTSFSDETIGAEKQKRNINVKLIPEFDENGGLTNIIATCTDITELMGNRKRIEELLKNENERLETLIELKTDELNNTMKELMEKEKMASLGSLVAGISHEINTPLGVAVTASSFLKDENTKMIRLINEGQLTRENLAGYLENVDESTRIMLNNLERASNLIASFKNISVSQSTEKEEAFNFYEYIQSILLMLKHEYKHTGLKFEIECPEDLNVVSYPGAYSQIFTNLIMNSLIHGYKEENGEGSKIDEGVISIKVTPMESDGGKNKFLRIEYRDNGVGISEENLKHIFDPFFTTARGTSQKSGSGLGLNIIYNLVKGKLAGSIRCESQKNKGVLFLLEIPYRQQKDL